MTTAPVEHRLWIDNPRGERLAAVRHQPHKVAEGRDRSTAVVAHGMLSSMASAKHTGLCRRLAEAGLPALRFDFAGRGESDGDPELLTVSREADDLRAVLDHLRRTGSERFVLVGSSLGGAVALIVAAERADVAALATVACPAAVPRRAREAWGGGGRELDDRVEVAPGVYISAAFFRDAGAHDLEAAARAVRVPWLVVHGDLDRVVPVSDGERLARLSPGARLWRVIGADHRFSDPAQQARLLETVADHLLRCSGGA